MSKDCTATGFGVVFGFHFKIGWWKDNLKNGNSMTLNEGKNVIVE